jgi:hypothetical protein
MSAKDFRSQPEPAPINSGPATTLLVFKVKPRVHQARSTAKSANRENSPKLALNPTRASSSGGPGVPDSGQMRVFQRRAREYRKLKTRWRMAQSDTNQSLGETAVYAMRRFMGKGTEFINCAEFMPSGEGNAKG